MPLPVAHGLIGASVFAALRDSTQTRGWKWLAFGAFLAIAPDFDYALNWLRISRGGWHHGFTHSIPFAVLVGLVTIVVLRQWNVRSYTYSVDSFSQAAIDLLKISLVESLIFGSILLAVILVKYKLRTAIRESVGAR